MSHALKLDQKLRDQVKSERKITHAILLTLQEIDMRQCYRELGYTSLYDYLIRAHGYSEGAANRRIQASRLLKSCPEVAPQVQSGEINLTQLAMVNSAFKQQERKSKVTVSRQIKQETLNALIGKNHFETQKILVNTFEHFELPRAQVFPKKNRKVQVNLEFDECDWDKIQAMMASLSHKVPDQKLESALIYWAAQVEKKMLRQKAESSQIEESAKKGERTINADQIRKLAVHSVQASKPVHASQPVQSPHSIQASQPVQSPQPVQASHSVQAPQPVQPPHSVQPPQPAQPPQPVLDPSTKPSFRKSPPLRRRIPEGLKRFIFEKAQYRCEYKSALTGKSCGSTRYLDIDHKVPLALGGSHDLQNLRVLCRSHNHLLAKQMHILRPE